ncbi:Ribonucleases P/MRP protein subunit POP1 [Linum perenne]
MPSDGIRTSQASILPPRKLNVQKFSESRASELDALHSIVSNRLKEDFCSRRNKRRRTTSYDNQASKWRYRKRHKSEASQRNDAEDESERRLPRRVRRREQLKRNPEQGFSITGDGTKRLRTHVWHAKRFTMTKLWGFHLPLGLHGRGKGSRAALRWLSSGAVVHDASYHTAVQLEGPEDSLLSVLRIVLLPSLSSQTEDATSSIMSGVTYGTAMLHHVGAPASQAIAPVTYLWRPSHYVSSQTGITEHSSSECNVPQSSELCRSSRQLWMWIHASAFAEGFKALKFACQKQMNEGNVSINCCSLEGQLAKIEVMGAKASQLLQRVLHPVSSTNSENPCPLKKCSFVKHDQDAQLLNSSTLEHDILCDHQVFSLTAKDPRTLHDNVTGDPSETFPSNAVDIEVSLGKSEQLHESLDSKPEGTLLADLWDFRSGVCNMPVDEQVLCLEKRQSRRDFISVNGPKLGILKACAKVQGSRSCPILLLKTNDKTGQPLGWSIIVPLSWARIFWNQFVSNEVHAIGLREKQWIACEVGLPHFPSDFPDCNAYLSFKTDEAASEVKKAEQKPLAVRSFEVPIPPPWNTVRATLVEEFRIGHQMQFHTEKDEASSNFNGFVARTSSLVISNLKQIGGDNLFLFPRVANSDSRLLALMKDENKGCSVMDGCNQVKYDHKLCFVRVILHAFKEGVIEEGSVVSAPRSGDIAQWTKRYSGRLESDDSKLQIPDHAVRSYFNKQSSGNWELERPKDPAAMESHRWPIGFVTTGFVRGSKKAGAEAFCEAILLARLREEQWKEMAVKERRKEIYVLVRNLRSSAYRLALATVVLEEEEVDVDFL